MALTSNFFLKAFGLVVLAGAAGAGYLYFRADSSRPLEFLTTPVARGEITQSITASGDIEPLLNVSVSSQISGIISSLEVDWNSPVKKGQILCQLDPSTYKSALESAEAGLANAEANYALQKATTDRSRELFKKSLVSQSDLDTAEAQLLQAAAQVKLQQSSVDNAQINLARCTIYSPIDGIVISRQCDVGNTVAASLSAPTLFQIANDLKNMEIYAAVAEADIGNAAEKQPVEFTVDAYPNRKFRGEVFQIRNSPVTQQNVVTYNTMISVRNNDLKLKPGMTANVSIIVARRPDALKIPNAALRVRFPEGMAPALPQVPGAAKPAAKPLSDDERRQKFRDIMRQAGFTWGNGPPSPKVIARAQQLARDLGLDLDFSRFGGREHSDTGAPVTRTLYRLVGADPKTAVPEAVSVKMGISDGISTEVLDGLKEGDLVISSVIATGAKSSGPSNPFGGPMRRF